MTNAMQLLSIVWSHGKKESWDLINTSMRAALRLAIGSGLQFEADDFAHMATKFRSSRWMGQDAEWAYRMAVIVKNSSFLKAFEKYTGRKPFFGNDVECNASNCEFIHLNTISRARERLAYGFCFDEGKVRWHVTSFNDEAGTITLCRYETYHREGAPKEVKTLTNKEILAMFPA